MAVTVANSTPYSNVETATTERLGILRPDGITTKINSDGMLEGITVPDIAGTNNFGMVMIEPDASKRTINIDRKGVISGADNVGIAVAPTYGTDTEGNEVVIKEGKEGVVKPDGKTVRIDSNGWLVSETYADPATTKKEGLVKPDGKTTSVDKDTGKLSAKIDLSTLKVFKGATKSADGEKGIVPQPTTADTDKYLSANGGWAEGKPTVNEKYDTLIHKRIYDESNKDVDGIYYGKAENIVISQDEDKVPTTAEYFTIQGETEYCKPLANKLYVDNVTYPNQEIPFRWYEDTTTPEEGDGIYKSVGVISLYAYRKAGDTGIANKINKKILDTTSAVYIQADLIKFKAVGTANADINLYIHCPTEILANSTDGDITYITSLAGVKVVRREEHYPTDETDGTLVIDLPYADFSKYAEKPYEDIGIETEIPYYYTAFPYTQSGHVCRDVGDANRTQAVAKEYEKYGFDITQDNDDPDTRVSYPSDCLNANWEPIAINLDEGTYYLGEWANTFFMKLIRPVMLNYDGTVAYELDHDDQTKNVDGYPSDINDENFEGNAMVEFPKMYFARWTDSDGKISHIRVSNIKLPDEVDSAGRSVASYHCYAHNTEGGSGH